MIYSIRGTVVHTEPNLIVVECGGVGYQCLTTNQTIAKLPKEQKSVLIYTYLQVREDALTLFGFYDRNELRFFKMLISVSGVGPKAALSILSDNSPERFALCVASGDYKTLTRSPGIGPKIAQRIVLELKDKISNEQLSQVVSESAAPVDFGSSNVAEAIGALVVLGYSQSEAASAVAKLDGSLPVEELIKGALKKLAMG
ncbi:Holliday junction branch migration protein RuvA [Zongyangia hominis]|uniref:Holliday junction branch migration complex subunit RuvA n=1 Tax=Zongyangia hominis TaxID=2763677 RepID=A0A926E8M5_9FIRM|nr:Holliday junction branch migration protein RuvA [Zongyangia hominis]MBC8569218.1 Holliday junction branch migration protein RuvA [Zongyangia hominis]